MCRVEGMIEDFNKRQRVIDLGEEAEDEILQSTGKTESTFDTPQYRRVMAACKERDKFPTQAWIPDEEDSPEEFMEDVYKKELGSDLEEVNDGVAVGLVDFTEDSEYKSMFEQHTEAMKQQSELIERWVEQEEKRLPPKPPMSPFT